MTNSMMLVELTVNRRWEPIAMALRSISEEQLRDAITWAVYTAVAECGESVDDVSVMWRVEDNFPEKALQIEMTAGNWQPANPKALWKAIQDAVGTTVYEAQRGGKWRVGGLVDMSCYW